jgi:hypothetical protein
MRLARQVGQPALQCCQHCLRAILYLQPLQDYTHVALYGRLSNAEQGGDPLIALSLRHQLQNFTLSCAEM